VLWIGPQAQLDPHSGTVVILEGQRVQAIVILVLADGVAQGTSSADSPRSDDPVDDLLLVRGKATPFWATFLGRAKLFCGYLLCRAAF